MRSKYALVMFLSFLYCLIFATDAFSGKADKIKEFTMSNIGSSKVTISWVTANRERAQIYYGEKYPFTGIAFDARGKKYKGKTHYMTITNLKPNTTYYYDIVSGGVKYNNDGTHYTVTTGPVLDPAVDSDIVYGMALTKNGKAPIEDAIVDIKLKDKDGVGTSGESQLCSTLPDAKGYWYVNLKNIRIKELDSYFDYTKDKDCLIANIRGCEGRIAQHK